MPSLHGRMIGRSVETTCSTKSMHKQKQWIERKRLFLWPFVILTFFSFLLFFSLTVQAEETSVSAVRQNLLGEVTDNAGDQNYVNNGIWSTTVKSYLMENADGSLTRVEYLRDKNGVLVETHRSDGSLTDTKILEAELPLFGGFFEGKEFNFCVYGQNNLDESDACEVLRIVKYSKAWERLQSASIYGANTYIPFDGGSLRMCEAGDSLLIHTCHEMYGKDDGLHHQANMTYRLSVPEMVVYESNYEVKRIEYTGYVSHSFNQFIQADELAC